MQLAQDQWFPRSGIPRPTAGQGGEQGEGGSGCGQPGAQGWHLTPSQRSEGTLLHKHVHFDGPHSW